MLLFEVDSVNVTCLAAVYMCCMQGVGSKIGVCGWRERGGRVRPSTSVSHADNTYL